MSDNSLPKAFRDLERFVPEWTLATEVERSQKRISSSMEALAQFYEAVLPRFAGIMSHLNEVPAEGLPEDEQRLLDLALTFVEVSNAMERFGQPDVPDSLEASRWFAIEGTSGLVPNEVLRGERT